MNVQPAAFLRTTLPLDLSQLGELWIAASGPRMLEIAGRYADGWWPAGVYSPEEYAGKLKVIRRSAEKAGRDPDAVVPALIHICFIGDEAELTEIFQAPLIKAFVLQIPAAVMQQHGFEHPLGPHWRGYHDVDPAVLTRDEILDMLAKVDPRAILAVIPHGTPKEIAKVFKDYSDAGMRVPKILDYSGMAGLAYAPRSAQKVREAEDEWMRLLGPCA